MTCLCKNPDGTLSEICFGTCAQKDYRQMDYVQQRNEKAIEDKMEYMLSIFLEKMDGKIFQLEQACDEKYTEGFKAGFELARELYE